MMDEKTLRHLIEVGSVKQMRIVGDGALFHVDVVTAKKGSITATTAKGTVKTWSTLDATARWMRSPRGQFTRKRCNGGESVFPDIRRSLPTGRTRLDPA